MSAAQLPDGAPASTARSGGLRGCFVVGTDTEVGKTCVSAALLHGFGALGYRCAGYKPVAAGMRSIGGVRVNEDVRALRLASSVEVDDAKVGPCQLDAACAPHIAAALQGRVIARAALLAGAQALAAQVDVLVVEGVGGFRVPLGPDFDSADLAVDLGLPVVLVVGMRLGCINHALLTVEAIRARRLRLAGWVANRIDPAMLLPRDNLLYLEQVFRGEGVPCLGVVPHFPVPSRQAVRAYLDLSALVMYADQGLSQVNS